MAGKDCQSEMQDQHRWPSTLKRKRTSSNVEDPDQGCQPEDDDMKCELCRTSLSTGRTLRDLMAVGIDASGMLHLTGGGLDEPLPLPNFTKELMSLTGQTGDMSGLLHLCRGDEPAPLPNTTQDVMYLTDNATNAMRMTCRAGDTTGDDQTTKKRSDATGSRLSAVIDAARAMGMYKAVADLHGMTVEDVKGVVESVIRVARCNLKKNGSFKLGGDIKLTFETEKVEYGDGGETSGTWTLRENQAVYDPEEDVGEGGEEETSDAMGSDNDEQVGDRMKSLTARIVGDGRCKRRR